MVCKAIDMREVQVGRLNPCDFASGHKVTPRSVLLDLGLGSLHPDRSTAYVPRSYNED